MSAGKEYFGIVATRTYLMEKAGDTKVINGVNTRFRHNRCKI